MPPRCCLVTDRQLAGTAWRVELPSLAGRAAEAGVDFFQVREHGLDARELAGLVAACRRSVQGSSTALLVNDRLDVALGEGADGVQLPERGLSVADARRHAPAGFLIGKSLHAHGADSSVLVGADFVIAGTVFATPSKPGRPGAGLEALAGLVRATALPVLAIGGVEEAHLHAVAQTGAAGIAAIRWLAVPDTKELRRRVRVVHDAFDTLGQLP